MISPEPLLTEVALRISELVLLLSGHFAEIEPPLYENSVSESQPPPLSRLSFTQGQATLRDELTAQPFNVLSE